MQQEAIQRLKTAVESGSHVIWIHDPERLSITSISEEEGGHRIFAVSSDGDRLNLNLRDLSDFKILSDIP